jgi:hypothetical protein
MIVMGENLQIDLSKKVKLTTDMPFWSFADNFKLKNRGQKDNKQRTPKFFYYYQSSGV